MKYKIAAFLAAIILLSASTVNAFAADVLIDKRNVKADDIIITETEAGIFKEGEHIILAVDRIELEDNIEWSVIEGDIEIEAEITDKNGLIRTAEISEEELDKYSDKCSYIVITILDDSSEASVIQISGLEMYLDRSLPNGEYKLQSVYTGNEIWKNSSDSEAEYDENGIFEYTPITVSGNYVNVITAGRASDDSTVAKEITIVIGDEKIKSGEDTIILDSPAYINAEGYTMLPLRAVAEALGASVGWDGETKSVSIMRGQRIVSLKAGERIMYINGTEVPMNTEAEIKNDRVFIPVRDVANALSISNIEWNEEAKTVTLN